MTRRSRSRRSYAIEALLSLVAVIALYLFLINGGPSVFGHWVADWMGTP